MDQNYKVGIIDDELPALEYLDMLISRIAGFETCFIDTNPLNCLPLVEKHSPEILLLDINMAAMDGVALAAMLMETNIPIVFITGENLEASEAFEVDAAGFVRKPVGIAKLTKVLQHVVARRLESKVKPSGSVLLDFNQQFVRPYTDKDQGLVNISLDEIVYIKSYKNTPEIHFRDKYYFSDFPLNKLEEKLKPMGFIRIHRQYIVNLKQVYSMNSEEVYLDGSGKHYLPIGDTYREAVVPLLRGIFT
ncbi:LytR/AlgR family response regulator transcription factor [Litoribacter populi]|uniref:LytR/AlgR family response regulator transcription factor n=1 Tax=Litoribacter populi TaxID=2598460 RepID=UPI00117DE29D|nr:LytTR family DNA-binding domain-containing protein [Litoribacter populi]